MCDCDIPELLEFTVGDNITFYYDGQQRTGKIRTVGKHGYWIEAQPGGCYGTAQIRCPFSDARKVE